MAHSAEPSVAIVILNWNLPQETVDCVRSVCRSTYTNYRVVLVDNRSSDDSLERFRAELPGLEVYLSDENLGYAGGSNLGIREALSRNADYVLILNNDTVVEASLLERLAHVAQSDPRMGILSPAIYYYDEPQRFWRLGAKFKGVSPFPVEQGRAALDTGQFSAPFEVDFVTGCAMWVRADVFKSIGFFDETYFMYYEDADFCQRARNAGYTIWVVPGARVWHKVSRSSQACTSTVAYYRVRNRLIFYRRYLRGLRGWLARLYIVGATLRQALCAWKSQALRRALLAGLADGLRA